MEVSYQSGLGSSENYFGVLGLALGGPKDNAEGDSDGMGTSFLDEAVTNGKLLKENAKFTFIFNKDQSEFILGANTDYIKDLKFSTLQLSRDSLYWRQNTTKNDALGVTGIRVNEKDFNIPKFDRAQTYPYMFDTASQMISIPQGNTWDSTAEDYYFFDRLVQTILEPLQLIDKKFTNVCFNSSYYYNSANNCYTVPCNTKLYKSVFFQLDSKTLWEVRPEDYILQELTIDLTDDQGVATGETNCKLAFTQSYENVFRFGIMAMQGYTMEFDTTTQTIRYSPSTGSTKVAVESTDAVFKRKMPEPEIPKPDDCLAYGINCPRIDDGTITVLTIAKLTSCLGGAVIWFVLLYWGITCLPDFPEKAQKLIAKLHSLKLNVFDRDLVVLTHDDHQD